MINLLPPKVKETTLYARRNTVLAHWLMAVCIGLLGVLATFSAGQFYLNQLTRSYAADTQRAEEQLKAQQLEETQQQLTDISSSLRLMIQVLSRQVLFSQLIRQTGAAIPPGAVLTNLNISKLEGGIDLQFKSTDYQTATQIQVNLEDPDNRIFEKADIVSIDCTKVSSGTNELDARYPCRVTARALFVKDNPFLFIKQNPQGAQS